MKTKFEYRSTLIQNRQNPVKALNDLGQEGWEAYAALRYDDDSIVHFLKRRLNHEKDFYPLRPSLSAWLRGK